MNILYLIIDTVLICTIITHLILANGELQYTYYSANIYTADSLGSTERFYGFPDTVENNIRYNKRNGDFEIKVSDFRWVRVSLGLQAELRKLIGMKAELYPEVGLARNGYEEVISFNDAVAT